MLRRSSLLTVAGERPSSLAISRTVRFSRRKSAITIRSSNDKYRGCRFGGVRMRTGG